MNQSPAEPAAFAFSPPELDRRTAILLRDAALSQLDFARRYTLRLLDATPPELWYQMSAAVPTHIAWQVGHLAVSQYGLLMFRQRGRAPGDLDLVAGTFRKRFGRGSQPTTLDSSGESPADLLSRLQTIHRQAYTELAAADPASLLEPIDMPYAVYPCKLGAILFAPLHEQIHSGQIGLIRRSLGLVSIH
jgi:hypothetical protein